MIGKKKKTILILIILFSFNLISIAQNEVKDIPVNTIPISYYKYLGKNEITNKDWKFFLDVVLQDSSATFFDQMTPDTALVSKEWGLENTGEYFFGDKYKSFPVVCISWAQANEYCKWLTNTYNENQKNSYNPNQFKKVVFRLPSKEEWQATTNIEEQVFNFGNKPDSKYIHCLEFQTNKKHGLVKTTSTLEKKETKNHTYNMNGNVAEMIDVRGIAMGGSWKDEANKCTSFSRQNYYGPSTWLGFRIFIEVIEE